MRIAYDGTPFKGWQYQAADGQRSVAECVEEALLTMGPAADRGDIQLTGAGRTDAGVHAIGQVAHCHFPHAMAPEALRKGLNGLLPQSVRVRDVCRAPSGFHARFGARRKRYRYLLVDGGVLPPHLANRAFHRRRGRAPHARAPLDLGLLERAAAKLCGEHDFGALSNDDPNRLGESTVRTLDRVDVAVRSPWDDLASDMDPDGAVAVELSFEARGFLYKQVRIMSGLLVACADGRISLDCLPSFLDGSLTRTMSNLAGVKTLPACGLTLHSVSYDERLPWNDQAARMPRG